MKKIYVEAYQRLNLGDDLFLKILFERYFDVEFYIQDCLSYKENFKEFKNVFFYRRTFVDKILHKISRCLFHMKIKNGFSTRVRYSEYDAYLNIGGSIFIDENGRNFIEREYKINKFLKRNKKIFILGCNFEKNYSSPNLERYLNLFAHLDEKMVDICFRDDFSYSLFKKCKCIRKAPDIVFGLKFPKTEKSKSIGISVIDLQKRKFLKKYEKDYIEKISELVNLSMKKKYNVVFFSFCEAEGDLNCIQKIVNSLSDSEKEQIEIYCYRGDINATLNKLASMELMIATRFHSTILSLIFKQGVLPIIYSDKTLNVLRDLKLNYGYARIENIKEKDVNILWGYLQKKREIPLKIDEYAMQHFTKFDEILRCKGGQ